MAPRSLWNGTVSVGLVHVPVKLYSATESKTIHFHEVHLSDGGRIEHRRFCRRRSRRCPTRRSCKGFEVGNGSYVALEKDEVEAAAGGTGHLIEIDHFVPARTSIPSTSTVPTTSARERRPRRLPATARRARAHRPGRDRTLHLPQPRVPGGDPPVRRRARAAHAALRRRGRRARRLRLLQATRRRAGDREVKMAGRLVESLHEDFDPERYKDELPRGGARGDRAQGGRQGDRPAGGGASPRTPRDLMAALEASLGVMARALWSGSLSFGLVNVPVQLFSAVARSGPALPPAAREGRRADRDAPLLLRGGRGGPL